MEKVARYLHRIEEALLSNHLKLEKIMADLSKLVADVAAEKAVTESAVALIKGLKDQLAAAGTDPQKLAELQASLEASTADLANAISTNTPVAPVQPVGGVTQAPQSPANPAPVTPVPANPNPPVDTTNGSATPGPVNP